MDRYTAAAMGRNISEIGDIFVQMNDPRAKQQGMLMRAQLAGQLAENDGRGITNSYLPRTLQSGIDHNNASAANQFSQAGLYNSKRQGQDTQNKAGNMILDGIGQSFGPPPEVLTDPRVPILPDFAQRTADELGGVLPPLDRGAADMPDGMPLATSYPLASKVPQSAAPAQPVASGFTPQELAMLASVQSNGGAADMATGQGKAAALSANSELDMRRAMGAQGQVMGQGEYFLPENSNGFQANDIAGAYQRTVAQEEGKNMREGANIIADSGGPFRSGTGERSGNTASKNPLNSVSGVEFTAKMAAERFGLANEQGDYIIDPANRAASEAWRMSVANMTGEDIPIQAAIAESDATHRVAGISRVGGGYWDGDPRVELGDFNSSPITPDQARQIKARYNGQTGSPATGGAERMFAAGTLNPRIAAMAEQSAQAAGPPPQAPAMIPAMLQRPPDPVPTTGPAKASDAFQRRESSTEQKAREGKGTRVKELQSGIAEITQRLESGKIPVSPYQGATWGGIGVPPPTARAALNNDEYNSNREQLIKMEEELKKLQGGPSQAQAQTGPADLEARLSKYR